MRAIVDADSMVYAAGFIADKSGGFQSHAFHAVNMIMNSMMEALDTDDYEVYLTGSSGDLSRKAQLPSYKGNRTSARPSLYKEIREYFYTDYHADIVEDMEADDIVCIRALQEPDDNCIVSIDKDLWTVPGLHYNWKKKELTTVAPGEANWNFYYQVLVGDQADNIKGCPGIGKAKAPAVLGGFNAALVLYDRCLAAYEMADLSEDEMFTTCQVLWMARELDADDKPIGFKVPT